MSRRVRSLDEDPYALALAAQNVYRVFDWREDDEPLRLPSDGDLTEIDGVLHVEEVGDIGEWEEVLGPPPQNVNCHALLYVALTAAGLGAKDGPEWNASLATLLEHALAEKEALNDLVEGQRAVIGQLERMVQFMSSTDRHSCEQALLEVMGATWDRLHPDAREFLLAAEQVYRTRDFAAPSLIVNGLAQAFEAQVKWTILPDLFKHLHAKKIQILMPPEDWPDRPRDRPVFKSGWRPEKCNLGQMERLFRHPEPAVAEFCEKGKPHRFWIREAIAAVQSQRNPASHGEPMSFEAAKDIRNQWLTWEGLPGGVFAAVSAGGSAAPGGR